MDHPELLVDGMTCGSCAARAQRVIGKLPGVGEAGVNFATGRASVELRRQRDWCGGVRGRGSSSQLRVAAGGWRRLGAG